MTPIVSLLFIAMIPIDCKIINFSLHLFVYFLKVIITIFGEFASATSKERMTTNIISWVTHPLINKSSYASKLCICVCLPRYRQRRAWKVSLLATVRKYGISTCELWQYVAPKINYTSINLLLHYPPSGWSGDLTRKFHPTMGHLT